MNASPSAKVGNKGKEGAERAHQSTIRNPQSAIGKRRVLLVDDEKKILASLRRLLRREDYELITANCGPEALELLEADPVQLIISDYRMPGMTGVELLREVRQRWPDTLRIILSGYSEVSTIIAAINEGEIYKFISKPWNDEEIKLHVRRALEQHELEEENKRMACEIAAQNERLRELNVMLEQRAADASTGLTSAQDLLETMKTAILLAKVGSGDPTALVPSDVLRMATTAGARIMNRTDIGTLIPGQKADITIVDLNKPHIMPVHRPDSALVYNCNGPDVHTVIVDGEVLLDAGRVTMLEELELLEECREAAGDLLRRAGIRGENNQQPTVNNQRKTEHAPRNTQVTI